MFSLTLFGVVLLNGLLLGKLSLAQECGIQTAPLQPETDIVGGKPAQDGEWPWQALIGNDNEGYYGGILIHPQWVLTHPAETSSINNVHMGSNNMEYPSQNLQTRTVAKEFTHPDYNGEFQSAATLLKLSTPFTITDYVRTVCVPDGQMDFNAPTTCTATGWGATHEYDPYLSSVLNEVEVDLTTRSYCEGRYNIDVPESLICAGGVGGEGICYADGPLVSKVGTQWYVVGVPTAVGYECAKSGDPGLYQYAPSLYDWIEPIFRGEDPPLPPTPPPPISTECGTQTAPLNAETKIVGGQPAQEGEWPWQALIQNGDSFYGGILVHPQWVLTWPAEHTTATTRVYMGSNNVETPSSNHQSRTVVQRWIHPDWDREFRYTVALLKLSSPFTITNYVRTVCVPDKGMSFSTGRSCIAAGWGSQNEYDYTVNPYLYEVGVEIAAKSYCRSMYYPYDVTDAMVCAGGEGGEGICHGDGPLVSEVGSKWYVVGVPSWGNGCARDGYPYVYTYAPAISNWINPIFDGENPGSGSSSAKSSAIVSMTPLILYIVLAMK